MQEGGESCMVGRKLCMYMCVAFAVVAHDIAGCV